MLTLLIIKYIILSLLAIQALHSVVFTFIMLNRHYASMRRFLPLPANSIPEWLVYFIALITGLVSSFVNILFPYQYLYWKIKAYRSHLRNKRMAKDAVKNIVRWYREAEVQSKMKGI